MEKPLYFARTKLVFQKIGSKEKIKTSRITNVFSLASNCLGVVLEYVRDQKNEKVQKFPEGPLEVKTTLYRLDKGPYCSTDEVYTTVIMGKSKDIQGLRIMLDRCKSEEAQIEKS